MRGIFISYRREDSGPYAGRLYDALAMHFGRERVFFDIDGISPGEDFREVIQQTGASCEVLLAVIGRQWATVQDKNGKLRLNNENDYVRIEIAYALKRGLRVIPVLVGGAEIPESSTLPEDLRDLVFRNSWEVSDKRFHQDVKSLVEALEKTPKRVPPKPHQDNPERPKTRLVAALGNLFTPEVKQNANTITPPRDKTIDASPVNIRAAKQTSSGSSLFPLYGIILKKSTKSDLDKIGTKTSLLDPKTKNPFPYYEANGINFWYDQKSGVVTHLYLYESSTMPEPWQNLGFQWKQSYDQWVSLLQGLGYSIAIEKSPCVERFEDHDSFSAEFIAQIANQYPHKIDLTFGRSIETKVSSPGTLYSMFFHNW